ncbi:EI24 domain-containing protein [Candidatus Uhrbacteria bacterium]|nr:EI24 domain-containing protein [Candidatus Uhrbacteria bacterium]
MPQKIADGFFLMFKGWGEMFQIKGIWLLLIVPVLINLALFAGFLVLFITSIVPTVFGWFGSMSFLSGVFGATWSMTITSVIGWIVTILIFVVCLIIYAFAFSIIAEILGAPFYEEIGLRIDQKHKIKIVERPWYKEVLMTLSQESRKLVAIAGIGIVVFFLQFIPVIGQIGSVAIGFGVLVLTLGADAVGPALYRRGLILSDRRRWVIKHIWPVMGMGLAKALGLVVPVLNIVVLPMAASGGTLLVQKYE